MKILHNLFCLFLLAGAVQLHAEALVKPLPNPDLSKLPPDVAKQLTQARAQFEKEKVNLESEVLGAGYAELGARYFHAGLLDIADIAFYDATQLAPKDARWVYLRGVIASASQRPADARANFEAALALDANYLPIRYRLADTLIELGDPAGAHSVLDTAFAQHKDVATLPAMLGRIELGQKRYAEAIAHLRAALALEPGADALYRDLAAAYAAQGDTQAANEAQAKAGATPPSLADPIVAGIFGTGPHVQGTPLQRARQWMDLRRFDEARKAIAEALKARPDDAEALALAARVDALLGNAKLAAGEAEQALKLTPNAAGTNLSAGMVAEFAGDDAAAQKYYERAVQVDARQPDARLLLGNALMRRGDYAQAAEQYRQLAAIAPSNDNAEARVAAALVAQGKCGDALADVDAKRAKHAENADLAQVFVRLSSTCPAATSAERSVALEEALALYKARPGAASASTLALAQAANGKFEDAQKSQAEAIFEVVRAGDTFAAKLLRETMQRYAHKQVPERPWPAEHPYFHPPMLTPALAAPAAK